MATIHNQSLTAGERAVGHIALAWHYVPGRMTVLASDGEARPLVKLDLNRFECVELHAYLTRMLTLEAAEQRKLAQSNNAAESGVAT